MALKEYLGDAVYVEMRQGWEGDTAVVVTTSDGLSETNKIVLEADVALSLCLYLQRRGIISNLATHTEGGPHMGKTQQTQQAVIVRTYSAGVHFGYLVSRNGQEVKLTRSRRIWSWSGALTLSELATAGLAATSKVAVAVEITLTQAIEIIECSDAAVASIEAVKWTR